MWLLAGCVLVGVCVWYHWPSATVESVQRELNRSAPIGAPRAEVESWLNEAKLGYRYSTDFANSSILEQHAPEPRAYSGYIQGILRDTDRGLFITGSILFYILFDDKDRVSKHVVKWIGTGL